MNNHTFDFAKQGYVNLVPHQPNSQYSKELFEARHNIIIESQLYSMMHDTISKLIKSHLDVSNVSNTPFVIVDLGCGEGSHLQKILDGSEDNTLIGIGLDIAKEGIIQAAKRYENPIWLVGDLAKSPLADQSCHVILNILSPSNYKEFKRIIVKDGLVVKVVPRSNYLIQLREALFDNEEKKVYKNDKTVELFKQHFNLIEHFNLCYTKKLNKEELGNLVKMTPLAWSSDTEHINQFINMESADITVDLDILVGVNNGTDK